MHNLNTAADLDALLADIGDATVVMLGEASHGTHEYYTWRAALSKRLIQEKGFSFIAVEGDWPDCYKINRFVKSYNEAGETAHEVLKNFDRWPTWMWANWEVAALTDWLHDYNKKETKKVGFYGLDVYSLWDSMQEMVAYLEKKDPKTAQLAKAAIHCFQPYENDEQHYARFSLTEHSCRDEVVTLLKEIRANAQHLDGDPEAHFDTEQNALIAVNAERYYRSMMGFDNESWNIRDGHMMETLQRLQQFHGPNAKAIVWEHNTHIGDARATPMKNSNTVNIGQLARETWGREKVYLVGFGSYKGSVIAGESWGAPMQRMKVPEARKDSVEALLHNESNQNRYLLFSDATTRELFQKPIKHRAIGVVYNPERERFGNYVLSTMPERYNAFVYLDETKALHPFHLHPEKNKIPETYPFGV